MYLQNVKSKELGKNFFVDVLKITDEKQDPDPHPDSDPNPNPFVRGVDQRIQIPT